MRHVVTLRNLSPGPQGPFFSVLDQYQSGLVVVWGDYINLKKVDSKRVLSGERRVWPDGIDNLRSSGASEPFRLRSQQTHPSDAAVSLYCFGCENTYNSGTPLTILSHFPKSGSSSVFNKVFVNTRIRTSIVGLDCQTHTLLYP